jgi:hypothetical protein
MKRLDHVVAGCAAIAAMNSGYCAGDEVYINGVALSAETRQALEAAYRTPVAPGRYWYDPISGAWGGEGGPAGGLIHPGLKLGGPLRADASRGNTGVFINGRQLHILDVAALSRCTAVIPGRYWVLASGVGGFEGGPAIFNLATLCNPQRAGGSSTQCENYGGGQFNCSNSNTGIGVIGEGGGKGAVVWGNKVITTP